MEVIIEFIVSNKFLPLMGILIVGISSLYIFGLVGGGVPVLGFILFIVSAIVHYYFKNATPAELEQKINIGPFLDFILLFIFFYCIFTLFGLFSNKKSDHK